MSNQLEFRHYNYFLAVAETLHFRKAAEQLFISQPGLSRQIKQMENELGIQLFERHNRKVLLTQAGNYLYKELKSNFKQLDDIIQHAKLVNKGLAGKLNIGFVGSSMQQMIPNLLLDFEPKNPNVLVNLTEMDNNAQLQALLNQDLDIGFVRLDRVPKNIGMLSGIEETFSLVLPKDHPISQENFIGLKQLKNESFILFDSQYSESYYEKVMQIFDDAGFYPNISHSTVNASSIYRLVENNLGISIVPSSLQNGYDMKVKFITLTQIPQRTNIKMIWNKENTNPVVQAFLKIVPKEQQKDS